MMTGARMVARHNGAEEKAAGAGNGEQSSQGKLLNRKEEQRDLLLTGTQTVTGGVVLGTCKIL